MLNYNRLVLSYRSLFLLLCLVIIPSHVYAQNQALTIIADAYKAFKYQEVIAISDSLLKINAISDTTDLTEIYRFRGMAHYHLGEMTAAFQDFSSLLHRDSAYVMNNSLTPPKILSFFNAIKQEYSAPRGTEQKPESAFVITDQGPENTSILFSVLLPGSGHIREKIQPKGWVLLSAGIVTLGSSIYFSVDAHQKEKEYLSTVDRDIIDQKYKRYNDAYKLRNISIFLYAAVWLYAQIDLLYLSHPEQNTQFSIQPHIDSDLQPGITLAFCF